MLYGRGAGARPTASAVVSDLCTVVRNLTTGVVDGVHLDEDGGKPIKAFGDVQSRHYFRLAVPDRPGVLARIARVLGEHQISISTVIQKETDEGSGLAELVIMTHTAPERRVEEAMRVMTTLPEVSKICNFVRVTK
jgi:homoserine dehydrogenase